MPDSLDRPAIAAIAPNMGTWPDNHIVISIRGATVWGMAKAKNERSDLSL
jgi:hypothetical protein